MRSNATECAWCGDSLPKKERIQGRYCKYNCYLEDVYEVCLEQCMSEDPATAKQRAGRMFLEMVSATA